MRDFSTYTIEAVKGYRSEKTDAALQRICDDIVHFDHYSLCADGCRYSDGVLEIQGPIWHDEIDEMMQDATQEYDVDDVPFMVCGIDYDADYYEDAPTCSFILNACAWDENVEVKTIWPEWSEDLRWKAE